MLDARLRSGVERLLAPAGAHLHRQGVSADLLTTIGLGASAVTAIAIGAGWFGLALLTLTASAATDVLDGSVAKSSGAASPRGAFFDSVADRISDSLLFGGVAWYLAGRQPRLAVLALAVLALSFLVSYERSRAESLGFNARGGLMERAERLIVLWAGLAFGLLVPLLWLMMLLSAITAGQRFFKVWRQAEVPVTSEAVETRRQSRWRATEEGSPPSRGRWWAGARGPMETRRVDDWWSASRPGSLSSWRRRRRSSRRRIRP
ncbi:MAG: CDP-alcohol phosphatidyltransferase family protein [Acidimicrobiia bacterium]